MTVQSERDLEGLRAIGRIVDRTLAEMRRRVEPGMTTAELDAIGERLLADQGARPTPREVYRFPGAACISIGNEVVHGIPGPRIINPGDIVKLDLTADRDGYVADATRIVLVPPVRELAARLADCVQFAFEAAARVARAGCLVREIGRTVEREVRRCGFSVVRELTGHGVGRMIHEPPVIPNFDDPHAHGKLSAGQVITIEPIISAGSGAIIEAEDGWTLLTADGALAAHYEQTLMITNGNPVILTAPEAA